MVFAPIAYVKARKETFKHSVALPVSFSLGYCDIALARLQK